MPHITETEKKSTCRRIVAALAEKSLMQKPTDWLWLGIAILAADLVVRHLLDVPGLVHTLAFVLGGAAIFVGFTQMIKERY